MNNSTTAQTVTYVSIPLEEWQAINKKLNEIAVDISIIAKGKIKEYFTVKEACEFLSVSHPTLYKYREKNIIKSHEIGGRTLFKYTELVEALKSNQRYKHEPKDKNA